jgi:hypothetical protein
MNYHQLMNKEVEAKYKSYPPTVKKELFALRKLILEVAKKDKDIDLIEEALKWRSPHSFGSSQPVSLCI